MPPDPHRDFFLAFTRDHDEDDASARFEARFGAPPAYILDDKEHNVLLVGPRPDMGARANGRHASGGHSQLYLPEEG